MARKRTFDLDTALETAMLHFWRHGYTATSVRSLCAAVGIQPGSFYAAFGSKEDCFRLSLERYLRQQALGVAPGEDAVRAWMDAITDPARAPSGCLLVSSAVEHGALDPGNQAAVSANLQLMGDFFWMCLKDRPSARADAAMLSAVVAGIHVMARAGASPERLREAADQALLAVGISPRKD